MDEQKGKRSFGLLVTLSVIIMMVAVVMIYIYTREYNPEVLQANAQSESASENVGFVNLDSPQVLETETATLTLKPFEDSSIFIIGAGVFMMVIVASFGIVKYVEKKDE